MKRFFSALNKKTQIGVLISQQTIKKLRNQVKPKFSIKELVKANQQAQVTLFFFSIKDVDFSNRRIYGTYFDEDSGSWEAKYFSYPDVLYSRRRGIESQKGEHLRSIFKIHGVKMLNPLSALDKWEVYKNLSNDVRMQSHLPLTIAYQTPEDLIKMLEINQKVYFKPRFGRLGKRVMRITQKLDEGYEYIYFTGNKRVEGQVTTIDRLLIKISRLYNRKKAIIQEGIDSLRINSRIVDFRAEIQRNGMGDIEVVGIFAKIGASHSHVTNLPSGADLCRFDEFVNGKLGYTDEEYIELRNKMEEFVIKAHQSIEQIYGHCGETAIDFVMDTDQHLWFLECNLTSTKKAFLVANEDEITIRKAFLNPIEYAIYLQNS